MKKEIINDFMDFIELLDKQKTEGFEFAQLSNLIFSLSQSDEIEEYDSVVPIGNGQYVVLISNNVFPDELEFINKAGNFVVTVMEIAHLNRVFIIKPRLITWTVPKNN